MARWQHRFCLQAHLYVGLVGGLLFVLMGLTGSTLVFYKAIDEWLNPDLLTTAGAGPYRPLSEVVAAARAESPVDGWLDTIHMPAHAHGTYLAWYKIPAAVSEEFRWRQVTIDLYTATILSHREWGGYLMSFIYELHESLLLDKLGETIVGGLALALLVSIGTGISLFFSYPRTVRHAWTFKPGGSLIRRHKAWHRFSGFVSAIVLLVSAVSGLYLAFPSAVVTVVTSIAQHQEAPLRVRSVPITGAQTILVEQAVNIARETFPEGEIKRIALPRDAGGAYRIVMRQPGEVRHSSGESQVWIDQYSGSVLHLCDWRTLRAGETFVAWLFPLHNGEAFGLAGRIIIFLTGFVPALLYVTALRMWWLKRAAHRRQKAGMPA